MRDDAAILAGTLAGTVGPLAAAGLMTPLRDTTLGVVIVLFVLTVVVATAAALGGPTSAAFATLCSGLSTDFLYVTPYLDLKYRPRADMWPIAYIVTAGIAITAIAWFASRSRRAGQSSVPPTAPPSRHIERVARLAAQGVDVRDLTSAVQAELTSLLLARSCRFDTDDEHRSPIRLERDGSITGRGFDPVFPATALEIPVRLQAQEFGRFTIDPTPDTIVPLDARIVAVVLTDHLAAAIARRPTVPPVQ